jgi:hypothetical protein
MSIRTMSGVPVHPYSAAFTACVINVMSTSAPLGTPCGQADGSAVPKAMLTNVMMLLMATAPTPPQSPTHGTGGGVAVEVGETPAVLVSVPVAVAASVGVAITPL